MVDLANDVPDVQLKNDDDRVTRQVGEYAPRQRSVDHDVAIGSCRL
jgi:hypothetical protein